MPTLSVALLIILIGFGLNASRADEQQNESENGEDTKHLFSMEGIRENQNALDKKVSGIEAKLELIENGMRDNLNSLAEKMSGIEAKLEKQIENGIRDRHKEPSPMKNNSTLALFHIPIPIFRWDASDCHPKIVINESANAIQRNATGTEEFMYGNVNGDSLLRSCRAGPIQMPSSAGHIGIIYAEYRILVQNGPLFIGLSTKEMPLEKYVGHARVSYGYANIGEIYGKNANGREEIISDNVPLFFIDYVLGCGLNLATRQLFFTMNGQRLNITNLYIDEGTADLYPTVTLSEHGDAVEANFGPNFKYDLSKES